MQYLTVSSDPLHRVCLRRRTDNRGERPQCEDLFARCTSFSFRLTRLGATAERSWKYVGWNSDDAVKHYLARIAAKIPYFETMEEPDLNYIKVQRQQT